MAELGSHRCNNCNMVFRSYSLLDKHRDKFCIGSHIGDPAVFSSRSLDTREKLYSNSKGVPRMAETPDFRTRDSIARLRARENLLNEREQHLMGGYEQMTSVSDSKVLRSLTDEFHKLRKSLEGSVPTLRSLQFQGETSPQTQWDREYRERMQDMAESHERHLADIQSRNQTLELQRDEIRQRLSDFANAGSSTSHIEQMLLELKAQEEKNQLALDALRDQIGLIQAESRTKSDEANKPLPPSATEKREKAPLNFIAFPARGSSLSSEISALQLAYVQSGGTDPSVLAQMRDLQTETMVFEEMAHKQERKEKKKKRHDGAPRVLDVELMAVELENQRLEEEILNVKLQRGKKKIDNGHLDSEMVEMQKEHVQQMAQLQAEIDLLRRDITRMPPRAGHGPPPFLPPPVAPPLPPPMHPTRLPPGRPEAAIMMGGLDSMRPPSPSASRHILEPPDALGPAPYDPVAGFVIFYDFVLGLEPTFQKVRLLSGLYSNGHKMGQSSSLPDSFCEMWHSSQNLANAPRGNLAMLSAKQPIPRVRPGSSIALVMELQASGGFNPYGQEVQRVSSCGWTKLDLFDHHNQVLSGRWKLPVRALPLRPGLSTGQLNTVPQMGKAELFVRVMNGRDAEIQSMAEIDPRNASLYQYPLLMSGPIATIGDNPAPQPSFHLSPNSLNLTLSPYTDYVDPPPVKELPSRQKASQRDDKTTMNEERELNEAASEAENRNTVGFIIDRVKDAPLGDGTLRLTGYRMQTGQVIGTRGLGMNFVTSAVSSSIKHGYFIFGEQEVVFNDVTPEEDMILMLRFYHWPGGSTAWAPWQHRKTLEPLLASEEWAAAWAVLRLTKPASPKTRADQMFVWDTGTHDLALYHSPAPPALNLFALLLEHYGEAFEQYGSARVRLCVFSTSRPDLPFPPWSPRSDNHIQKPSEDAFIPHSRGRPASKPYSPTDGIHLYIDGARLLPDAVTVTRVTGRVFDKNFDQIGPDISTGIDLYSDIFQPFYNYSTQIQAPNIPPTATLLLKVYTIDRFSRELVLIGWASLSLFVESGTQKAPISDSGGVQISLNEGAHQIRLYHRAPPTDRPFSVEALELSGRVVPCATLLLRLVKASGDKNHHNLKPILLRPEYSQGVYYSDTAQPTQGEIQLQKAMMNRSVVLVRDVIPPLAGSAGQGLISNEQLSSWVQKTFFEQMTTTPRPFQLTYVSRYLTMSGVKVSVDRAQDLPWPGFTFAHICFNPPAAFYFGQPWLKYDYPIPVEDIDLSSHQKFPVWQDGFKCFPRRMYHEHLTVLFQLNEVILSPQTDSNSQDIEHAKQEPFSVDGKQPAFRQGMQAWTALHVFNNNYCNTDIYQLPLYQGAPSQAAISALQAGDCDMTLNDLEQKKMVQLLPSASLIVRIADGRRDEELNTYDQQDINQTYLPSDPVDSYSKEPSGEQLSELIPHGLKEEDFKKQLANWFRKYVSQNPTPSHHRTTVEE
ncbi:coiled-coil domain-containing protein 17 isoform X1 [Ascaphus truei]|uniref:coiled-coil domain-containing protein 17 isoform X1 n=2 Tax=Ascaphus truei TaxID=8439 RepID=UPI003F593F7E